MTGLECIGSAVDACSSHVEIESVDGFAVIGVRFDVGLELSSRHEPYNLMDLQGVDSQQGVSLCFSLSRLRDVFGSSLVEAAVSDHRIQHVESSAGQTDDRGVVFLAFGAFPLVISFRYRVVAGGHPGGSEQRIFELLVARACREFSADGGPRAP
ncbi:hypothetical protein A6F49_00415 [Enteractinococcus helveticum]|uniref:Uncharacterized protein n=1 Tax=Enteractinococcus helveticum TaxID=1837282 RepID=A0A1B7LVP1_9MICC|nr:hypothetical protein A6F49_00415 [Enteractinococcus helveticum]